MTGARNCAWDAHKTAHVPNKEELRIKEENQGDAPPSLARGGSVARKAADAPRGPRGVAERRAAAVAEAEAKASAESKLQTAAAEELRLARQRIEGMAPAERGELRAAALAGASEWERNRIGDKDHTRSPSLLTLMAAELKRHEQPQAKE